MLENIRGFLGREKVKYVIVTVAFAYSVFLTFKSNFLLCLLIIIIYVVYDEKRNELFEVCDAKGVKGSHKKGSLNKAYAREQKSI